MGLFLACFLRSAKNSAQNFNPLELIKKLFDKLDSFIAGFGLNSDYLAQVGHFSVSCLLTYIGYTVGWVFGAWYAGILIGFLLGGPWVYWKEVLRDQKPPENAPFWPQSGLAFLKTGLCDACFYWAGILTATAVAAGIGMAFPR